jgi:hypothetical protein
MLIMFYIDKTAICKCTSLRISDILLIYNWCCFFVYISFDRFQQTQLVLLNIGQVLFGPRSTVLLTNMMVLLGAAAVSEWRLVWMNSLHLQKLLFKLSKENPGELAF